MQEDYPRSCRFATGSRMEGPSLHPAAQWLPEVMDVPLAMSDAALLAACRIETFRPHGPGGQHANRTDGGVTVQCQDHREQRRNQMEALRRLRLRLACSVRGQGRRDWLMPWLRQGRFLIGASAGAYPQVVAVALDALAAHAGGLAETAADLGCSTSQLARLLCADKEVRQAADAVRAQHGLGRLHD